MMEYYGTIRHFCQLLLDEDVDELQKVVNQCDIPDEIPMQFVEDLSYKIHLICDIDGQDSSLPLIHIAAATGKTKSLLCLLNQKHYVNLKTKGTKSTPLMYASYNGQTEAVRILLSEKCDVNYQYVDDRFTNGTGGPTALVLGVTNTTVTDTLLEHGACINSICEYERGVKFYTPLAAAISAGNADSVQLILKAGALISDICEFNHPHTALDMAVCCSKYPANDSIRDNMLTIIDILLENNADPNILSHDQPLIQNVANADKSVDTVIMEKLYMAGANIEHRRTPQDHTLLTRSIISGKPEQVRWLLKKNCELDYKVSLDKNMFISSDKSFTPIELSQYLSVVDFEWALSLAHLNPDLFLFLTRQLAITEMLHMFSKRASLYFVGGISKCVREFDNNGKALGDEITKLMNKIRCLIEQFSRPQSLKRLACISIRNSLHGENYEQIYNLGLPHILVTDSFYTVLDRVLLPMRTNCL